MNMSDLYANPIVQAAIAKYQSLSDKDQLALKMLAIFFALIFMFYGLLAPAMSYSNKAQGRYAQAAEDLGWMKANTPSNLSIAPKRSLDESLVGLASSTAKKYYVTFSRYESQDENTLKLNFERVLFKNLVLWLEHLEKNKGVSIATIRAEQLESKGYVSAVIVLKG